MRSFLASHPHVVALAVQAVRLCFWLVLLMAVFAPLEYFFAARPARLFRKGWATDLAWYFINNGLTPVFLLGPPAAFIAASVHTVLPVSVTGAAAALPLWGRMVAAIIVGEVGFYWGHRWSHEIAVLWRFHAVHHSARQVDFLVNTRAHPVDMVFTRLCGMVLLFASGLAAPVGPHPGLVPAMILTVGSVWSYFIHANLRWRLGPFEQVLSSPAFHHWHHTLDDHKDHNYASMLPVMDRIFGTFHLPRRAWPAAYGIATPMPSSLGGQLVQPFMVWRGRPPTVPPAVTVSSEQS